LSGKNGLSITSSNLPNEKKEEVDVSPFKLKPTPHKLKFSPFSTRLSTTNNNNNRIKCQPQIVRQMMEDCEEEENEIIGESARRSLRTAAMMKMYLNQSKNN